MKTTISCTSSSATGCFAKSRCLVFQGIFRDQQWEDGVVVADIRESILMATVSKPTTVTRAMLILLFGDNTNRNSFVGCRPLTPTPLQRELCGIVITGLFGVGNAHAWIATRAPLAGPPGGPGNEALRAMSIRTRSFATQSRSDTTSGANKSIWFSTPTSSAPSTAESSRPPSTWHTRSKSWTGSFARKGQVPCRIYSANDIAGMQGKGEYSGRSTD